MPGYQEIGPASTPLLYFEDQFRLSQQQAAQQYQNWQNQYEAGAIDIDTFTKEAQDLQIAADEQTAAFQSGMQMMQQSQKFVDLKIITPEESQEAMWAQVLPRELHEKMYPQQVTDPRRAPFTPNQMGMYHDTIEDFVKGAVGKKYGMLGIDWLKKDIAATQKSLLRQYSSWQKFIGYGDMTAGRQRQVDYEWDTWIADKDMNWNPEDKEVLAIRGKGPLTRGYGAQFRGTPTGPREATNPLQNSIAADLSKRRKPEPKPKPEPQPRIYIRNRSTKKRMFSDDGGQTWQNVK